MIPLLKRSHPFAILLYKPKFARAVAMMRSCSLACILAIASPAANHRRSGFADR